MLSTDTMVLIRALKLSGIPFSEKLIDAITHDRWQEAIDPDVNDVGIDIDWKIQFYIAFSKGLFKKLKELPIETELDPDLATMKEFFKVEKWNKETNLIWDDIGPKLSDYSHQSSGLLLARRWKAELQRFFQGFSWDEINPVIRTGARVGVKSKTPIVDQLKLPVTVTAEFLDFLHKRSKDKPFFNYVRDRDMNYENPFDIGVFHPSKYNIVKGARSELVPKTAKVRRFVAPGATMNTAYQCGVGRWIGARYKYLYKLDIRTLAEDHKVLAMVGSVNQDIATIDLTQASNTIARRMLEYILPNNVWEILDAMTERFVRVPYTADAPIEADWPLELFMLNGNGFCFELETVLFYTLLKTAGCRSLSVYGDDIVVHNDDFDLAMKVLRTFRFIPNKDKSYANNPFRESCGGDFYKANPIRPVFVKALPTTTIELVRIANNIREKCYYAHGNNWVHRSYRCLWLLLCRGIPLAKRNFGPRYYGDDVINTENTRMYALRRRHGTDYIRVYAENTPKEARVELYEGRKPGTVHRAALAGQRTLFLSEHSGSDFIVDRRNIFNEDVLYRNKWRLYRERPEFNWDGDVDSLFAYLASTSKPSSTQFLLTVCEGRVYRYRNGNTVYRRPVAELHQKQRFDQVRSQVPRLIDVLKQWACKKHSWAMPIETISLEGETLGF